MGSLQTELVRANLADPEKYKFDINLQAVPQELQQALRRLRSLESKFPLMETSTKILLAVQHAGATTVAEKVPSINNICDYLDTL